MKKVLFATLALAVTMTGFAQRASYNFKAGNDLTASRQRVVERTLGESQATGIQFNKPEQMIRANREGENYEEFTAMTTNYDLQGNSALGNRIVMWPDGCASFTATWDFSGNTNYPDRGTGYNFYSPENGMGEEPGARQEPMKSGWPSIAKCGEGELLASHATGTNVYYRPTKGEGEWTLVKNFPDVTWPRIVTSGPNDQYVNIIFSNQENIGTQAEPHYLNHLFWARSTDGGQTWTEAEEIPQDLLDNTEGGMYNNILGADDYVMAANGNNVAILFGSYTTDLFYLISHDNGETWEKQTVFEFPIEGEHGHNWDNYPEGFADTLFTSDNSHTIAIDNHGTVHVAFALFAWHQSDIDHYQYWLAYNHGIVYWNSNYTNEQGGHNIPNYGDWSHDAEHADWVWNGLANTLWLERIDLLAKENGYQNLYWTGYQVDEDGNGEWDYTNDYDNAKWHYRTFGWATMPAISVDDKGNMIIAFVYNSDSRICSETNFPYKSVFVSGKDSAGQWFDNAINLSEGFTHQYSESYSLSASPVGYDNTFWVMYQDDLKQGLYLDKSDDYPESNGGDLTENFENAMKIIPVLEGWDGIPEHEAINPMTTARVYPNPATDMLNIEVNASQASEMSISVYNIMGQMVMNQNVNLTTGINTKPISISNLTSGVYFVTVKANGFENTMKFIVK